MSNTFVPAQLLARRGPADPPSSLLGGDAGHRTIADVPLETCLTASRCPRGTGRLGLRPEFKHASAAKLQLVFEVQRRGTRVRPLP
jgi:hypothetical protein